MFDIEYNGEMSWQYGIRVQTRPNIPVPVRNIETIEIPGRDEFLHRISDVAYNDIIITIEMGFYSSPNRWGQRARQIKQWLSGSGKLKFSDDPDVFYKVKNIELDDVERNLKKIGLFVANFTCSPFCYIESGSWEMSVDEVKYNPYMTCHPIYKITGNGQCALSINGNTMKAEVGQNLVIDTERMLAFREDGSMQNTAVTGDYEAMYLVPGDNEISITSGFGMTVIPQWRCL